MRALVIDGNTRQLAQRIQEHARTHKFTTRKLLEIIASHPEQAAGNQPEFVLNIPMGYKVVYTIEKQPRFGWCHHISVSVDTDEKLPAFEAVDEIVNLFGLGTPFKKHAIAMWLEDTGPASKAINLLYLRVNHPSVTKPVTQSQN